MSLRSFVNGALVVAVLFLVSGTIGDPDLWGHLRFGQDMIAAGSVRVPDRYSFTTDRPWVNHEWLAEVSMAGVYDRLGPAGLNLARIALVLSVLGLVWQSMARAQRRQKILVASAGALGMLWRAYPIRPQLFSLFFFATLLWLLVAADRRGSSRLLWLSPLVFALWVNAHGGWIVGLAVLGLWCAMSCIAASWERRITLVCVCAASAAATLVNPYGYGMWQFLWDVVGVDRPLISDWLPLYELPWSFWPPWVATLGVILFTIPRARGHLKYLVIAIALGIAAIRVSRLDAFFAIAAMFAAARVLDGSAGEPGAAEAAAGRSLTLAGAFAGLAVIAALLTVPRVLNVPMAPGALPDKAVADYVRAQHLKGRLLIWFDWGEYAIWQFGPDLKVSMDGRRETVYSPAVIDAHMQFYQASEGASQYADAIGADYVWIPATLPAVAELRRSGWQSACAGPTSVLLTRHEPLGACVAAGRPPRSLFPAM